MEFVSDLELGDFFSNSPLYSKIKFVKIQGNTQLNVYEYLASKGHKDFCHNCKDFQTFRFTKKYGSQLMLSGNLEEFQLPDDGAFSYSFDINSTCQFCGQRKDFFINIFSVEKAGQLKNLSATFSLRKIGQFPSIERRPASEVYAYLTQTDRDLYSKALGNLSNGYGIGAYAYFRRIIENEIKRIIADFSQLEIENSDKVKQAWDSYNNGKYQMSNLIDAISGFLPISLKDMGGNPLKLLYQQASEGIHNFSEEECLEKSQHIDKLLQFVIKRTASLKNEIQDIQSAMKSLSK